MEQESSLRAKQSEMENSIFRTKQKEVCEISVGVVFGDKFERKLRLRLLNFSPKISPNDRKKIFAFSPQQKQAEQSLQQTKKTELMLMAKYQSLQKYAMELSERETKVARERLDVSQEKLELQSQRKKLFETRCSLCKIGEKASELKGILKQDPTDFDDINSANNEQMNVENFASTMGDLGPFYSQEMNFMPSLENVPNLADMSDDFLDSDLLMLKFDILKSNRKSYKDF